VCVVITGLLLSIVKRIIPIDIKKKTSLIESLATCFTI